MKVKTQSKKVNKAWLNQHVNDPWVKLAQKEGYRARAAFKLKEIDETFGLLRPGQCVVDLGSSPGAWSQYLRRRLAPAGAAAGVLDGQLIALDLLPMEPVEGVHFIQGDFREPEVLAQLEAALQTPAGPRPVDVVVSDMAPNRVGCGHGGWGPHQPPGGAGGGLCQSPPQARRGAGGQGLPWQWVRRAGQAVSRHLPPRQTLQTQGLARQIVGNLSGRYRSEVKPPEQADGF